MIRLLNRLGVSLALFLILSASNTVFADANIEAAKSKVSKIGENTIAVVKDSSLNEKAKEQRLVELFNNIVNSEWMARFVAGRYFRTMTPEQQATYIEIYKDYLVYSYVPKFKEYSGQVFKVIGARADDNGVIVQTVIENPSEPSIRVDYKLLPGKGNDYKVVDINAEGVSLLATQRSEFASVLSSRGTDSFIDLLKTRLERMKAAF